MKTTQIFYASDFANQSIWNSLVENYHMVNGNNDGNRAPEDPEEITIIVETNK